MALRLAARLEFSSAGRRVASRAGLRDDWWAGMSAVEWAVEWAAERAALSADLWGSSTKDASWEPKKVLRLVVLTAVRMGSLSAAKLVASMVDKLADNWESSMAFSMADRSENERAVLKADLWDSGWAGN